MMVYHLFVVFFFFLVGSYAQEPYSVTVVNNVAPCSNGNYATISLFPLNGQDILTQGNSLFLRICNFCLFIWLLLGQDFTVVGADISEYVGLGIQENGEYCRVGGADGCDDPGMFYLFIFFT
jgi:hypothetical protein